MLFTIILCIAVLLLITMLFLLAYINVKTKSVCLSSRHLVGKVVLVTGGTSGIGYATAVDLAERGARVLVASNEAHGEGVRDTIVAHSGNSDVHFIHLDLASLDSVRSAAKKILSTEKRLDILINNAGVLFVPNTKSVDGILLGIQINYLGPFLLTNLLLPLIIQTPFSRVINVSSKIIRFGRINLNTLAEPRTGCLSSFQTYSDSKLCVALMTVELARRLQGTGVTANFLHPGSSVTNIFRHDTFVRQVFLHILLIKYFTRTPKEAAQTTIHLAVSADVKNLSGCYFRNCRKVVAPEIVCDEDLAKQLWNVSNDLINFSVS